MRLFSLVMCTFLFTPAVFAETVQLKAKAQWVSEAPVEKITGSAKGRATLTMNGDDFSTLKGDIVFKVGSMKSGNDTRDKHLRSAQWLDAATYPDITFSVESVEVTADTEKGKKVKVSGSISIHGVSQPLSTDAIIKTLEKDGKKKIMIKTKFEVELGKFNIEGKKGIVGKKVGKTIQIKTTLKGLITA